MDRLRSVAAALVACSAASCGGASAEQAALQRRVDALERRVDAIAARDHAATPTPLPAIAGVVLDTDGAPASNVAIAVIAADTKSDARSDAAGHFEIRVPAPGEVFVYAFKNGRSAHFRGAFDATKTVTLHLVQPGTIDGTFVSPDPSAKAVGWITPGHVAAVLPGLWGMHAVITGDHFRFDDVPAGDVEIHLAVGDATPSSAHALVHVESGQTTTVKLEPTAASASVSGQVRNSSAQDSASYEAFLLLPDGSPEAWYPIPGGRFGFGGRTPGDRVVLLVAKGFKPVRVPVKLEANKETRVDDVVLEPLAPGDAR